MAHAIVIARYCAVAVIAAVGLAGCTAGPVSNPTGASLSTSAPVVSTSPVSVADRARQDALASYRGMWGEFVAAGRTSDWQSPALGRYATGIALTNLTRSLYTDRYNGLITKGEPVLNPSVRSVDPPDNPAKIVVTDCGDSTQFLKYRGDNGLLADDEPGGHHLINAIVDKQADGLWKVSDYGVHDVGTC